MLFPVRADRLRIMAELSADPLDAPLAVPVDNTYLNRADHCHIDNNDDLRFGNIALLG